MELQSSKGTGDIIPTVLLHGVCHNPTGLDYSESQIRDIAKLLKKYKAHAVIDIAYQGLGKGFEEDSFMVRHFAAEGIPTIITYSYSKNLSAYNRRVGLLASVNQNPEIVKRVQGRAERDIVRPTWSNPPEFGEHITRKILSDPELTKMWIQDVERARNDINGRRKLIDGLIGKYCPTIGRGLGLFSITGLTPEQVDELAKPRLDEKLGKKVYIVMPRSGRINIGSIADYQIPIFCDRVKEVLKAA